MLSRIQEIAHSRDADKVIQRIHNNFNRSTDEQKLQAAHEFESDLDSGHHDTIIFKSIMRILDYATHKQSKHADNPKKHFPAVLHQVAINKLLSTIIPMYVNSLITEDNALRLWQRYFDQLNDAGKAMACQSIAASSNRMRLVNRAGKLDKALVNILCDAHTVSTAKPEDLATIKYKYLGSVLPMYVSQIRYEEDNHRNTHIVFDNADGILKDFTRRYEKLDQDERERVNTLIQESIEAYPTFKWPEILPRVFTLSKRDRERFPKAASATISEALNTLINRSLDLNCDFLATYHKFGYCPLVLQAYSNRYMEMDEETRTKHIAAMLEAIDPKPTSDFGFFKTAPKSKYNAADLEDILGFARTMTISVENAKGMPGKTGTSTFTRKNPETEQDEVITYDVKFVENFPMVVADRICEKLYPKQAKQPIITLK